MSAIQSLRLALLIVAVLLLALAAFSVPAGRVVLGWLGLAFFAAASLAG